MSAIVLGPHDLRGLTLWRPWPWAFLHAGKRVENRSWPAPQSMVGKYIALHAGKHWDVDAAEDMADGLYGAAASLVPPRNADHRDSVIVAVARLTGCYERDGHDPMTDPWAFGPFCWKLPNAIALPEPVECKGARGLWIPDEKTWRSVRDQVAAATAEKKR